MSPSRGDAAPSVPTVGPPVRRATARERLLDRIRSVTRRRRPEPVRDDPPRARDTQVVIAGTSVWTGVADPRRGSW
ncbi:hypothetical protein [Intrasporangium sp.]|uniref:hypothetical protein n=1 Tax=Intrasporangium sp. TaxID=1925024 RepID=UPI003221756C